MIKLKGEEMAVEGEGYRPEEPAKESWQESIKEITNWLVSNAEMANQINAAQDLKPDERGQLLRIARGDLYRHEISFLRDIEERQLDSISSCKEIISYVQQHFDELYPVGIGDDEGGWR